MTQRKPSLDTLAQLVKDKRGSSGIRSAANDIGISPATLSRIENGYLPDLTNFRLLCRWLEIDPNKILGFETSKLVEEVNTVTSVHFKKKSTTSPETAEALAAMILRAERALLAEDET